VGRHVPVCRYADIIWGRARQYRNLYKPVAAGGLQLYLQYGSMIALRIAFPLYARRNK